MTMTPDPVWHPTTVAPARPTPREELEEMVARWKDANVRAEETGDWATHLGAMYTDDALYRWNIGPNEEFVARGKQEIIDYAVGYQMDGFQGWQYPYDRFLIDEKVGEVVGFWRQIAPVKRDDGTDYVVSGVGGSWFRYGGDFKWSWQRDFFDLGNVMALFAELAADGKLDPVVKKKLHTMATSKELLPGHEPIRKGGGALRKVQQGVAIAKVFLFGK